MHYQINSNSCWSYGHVFVMKIDQCNCYFSPVTYAWSGGAQLANDPKFNSMCVTRAQFEEHGHAICQEKFDV